jgi:hypothetical protein
MEASRKSGRVIKPKRHFESASYPSRQRKGAPPVPHIALQPVIAENSSISDFQPPEAPLEIPEFNKLAIDYHDVYIFILEGTRDVMWRGWLLGGLS